MKIISAEIEDILIISPQKHSDDRGYFMESFRLNVLEQAVGETLNFVQDNVSFSREKNTIRGLHYQAPPHAQGKLVRCSKGRILDVAVDIRAGSETYGNWYATELSADNLKQLWVPAGFLHGFRTLEPNSELSYKCTDYYSAECDAAIAWNDPDIGINWGDGLENPILSEKDRNAPLFSNLKLPF